MYKQNIYIIIKNKRGKDIIPSADALKQKTKVLSNIIKLKINNENNINSTLNFFMKRSFQD